MDPKQPAKRVREREYEREIPPQLVHAGGLERRRRVEVTHSLTSPAALKQQEYAFRARGVKSRELEEEEGEDG
jgi:hypothetical protein